MARSPVTTRRSFARPIVWAGLSVLIAGVAVQTTRSGIDILALLVAGFVLLLIERTLGDWVAETLGPVPATVLFAAVAVLGVAYRKHRRWTRAGATAVRRSQCAGLPHRVLLGGWCECAPELELGRGHGRRAGRAERACERSPTRGRVGGIIARGAAGGDCALRRRSGAQRKRARGRPQVMLRHPQVQRSVPLEACGSHACVCRPKLEVMGHAIRFASTCRPTFPASYRRWISASTATLFASVTPAAAASPPQWKTMVLGIRACARASPETPRCWRVGDSERAAGATSCPNMVVEQTVCPSLGKRRFTA